MREPVTDRARAVIARAREAARARDYNCVGTEHLLLGLLTTPGVAAEVLASTGMTAPGAEAKIAAHAGATIGGNATAVQRTFRGRVPFAPRAKKVLDLARREAGSLGQESIDAEHILLGLLLEHDGVAARMLRDCGTDPARMRAEVLRRIPSSGVQTREPESANVATSLRSIRVGSTSSTRRLLMVAAEHALDDGRSAFDAGDLLIALTHDETFMPLLANLGISQGVASEAIKRWRLTEERPGPSATT